MSRSAYHHSAADDGVDAGEGDNLVCDVDSGNIIGSSCHIAQVSYMPEFMKT